MATLKRYNGSNWDTIDFGQSHYIGSLSTVAGNASSGSYLSVRWYVSSVDGITTPYDGMKVLIKIPLAGVGTAGVMLSINGNNANDYHPLAYNVNTVLTTHFPVNSVKMFTYDASQTMTCYKTSNTATTVTGVWKAEADYDSNTTITYGTLAYYLRPYMKEALYRYKLVMFDNDNRLVPLTTTNNSATAYSDWSSSTNYAKDVVAHRSGKWYKSLQASNKNHAPESNASWWTEVNDKTPTSSSFRPDKIYWYNTTTTISAGAVIGGNTLMSVGYNQPYLTYCNFNKGILAYRLVYLCGTYNKTTGLFTLNGGGTAGSDAYYVQVPTSTANLTLSSYFTSGKDYILVGGTYSSNNYFHLREDHPMYHFDGTNLVPYDTYNENRIEDLIPTKTSDLTNDSGFLTGITSSQVTNALGYTPYNSTNPNGYITSSSLSSYVTTNTSQSITGQKTFTSGVKFKYSSTGTTAITLTPANPDDDFTLTLPAKTGTLATLSDIPTVSTAYLSNTPTSRSDSDTTTNYLIGKSSTSATGTNYYNSKVYFKGNKLYSNGTEVSVVGHTHSNYLTSHLYRPIQMNGSQILANSSSSALNLIAGTGITLSNSGGSVTIASSGGGLTLYKHQITIYTDYYDFDITVVNTISSAMTLWEVTTYYSYHLFMMVNDWAGAYIYRAGSNDYRVNFITLTFDSPSGSPGLVENATASTITDTVTQLS